MIDIPKLFKGNIMFMTDEQINALRERNEQRVKLAKEKLGTLWTLHKDNAPEKKSDTRILR